MFRSDRIDFGGIITPNGFDAVVVVMVNKRFLGRRTHTHTYGGECVHLLIIRKYGICINETGVLKRKKKTKKKREENDYRTLR